MASSLELRNGASKVLGHDRKEEEEEFSHAMQLVTSTVRSMSLQTAIKLGVFDIIAKAGEGAKLSSAEIVAQMSTNNPDAPIMVDRMLRLLASHSVLICSVVSDESAGSNARRFYSLCPVSKYFVTNEDGVSLGPLIALQQGKVFMDSCPHLKASILEGGVAFEKAHGMNAFVYSRSDPKFNHVFNTAMYSQTTIVVKNILKFYEGFDDLKQLRRHRGAAVAQNGGTPHRSVGEGRRCATTWVREFLGAAAPEEGAAAALGREPSPR
ncbi:hypothetical protein TIFTF001_051698 [Ficus carica]|uniref:Plant methyltransferase dimerisation domain-containing protein n=1 Tax=Ficus carica TaxID=3494 RepID=A0AA87Z401_FICCA|nr:hypothetical protein TIFTF001_051698 [Ficus carica]